VAAGGLALDGSGWIPTSQNFLFHVKRMGKLFKGKFMSLLREAQAKGFAEADATLDIDGSDAAQKLKILAELAFNAHVDADAVQVEGIREISSEDVQAAREFGYVIKQVAEAELHGEAIALAVRPMLLPATHPLAGVRDENNAVLVRGDAVGEMLFSGKGAGSLPSASAVLSDVVDIACHQGGFSASPRGTLATATPDELSRQYLRFTVDDPSAIGPISAALERNCIGVARAAAVWAKGTSTQHQVRVLTQACPRTILDASLRDVARLGLEKGQSLRLRVAE
jgi:homoserine dehydrogenase